jgi:hypothetical protein
MSEVSLELIKNLAQQLSSEDRHQLFNFLANLSDSGIQSHSLEPPPTTLDDAKEINTSTTRGDNYAIVHTDTMARLLLKDRIIFDVFYYPENFRQSRMEVDSWKEVLPSEAMKEQIRSLLTLHGAREVADEDIIAACRLSQLQIFQVENDRISREVSARLPHMTALLFDAGITIIELSIRNAFADQTGQQKKTLDQMIKILDPYWRHIKAHLGVSPGGRRTGKHEWTVKDHSCLTVHYERLKPIWREAKKTAKAAQMSEEPIRRNHWKEEVATVYQEEALPADLIERLALPQATAPADLALRHAARICVPEAHYSTKVLKEKLRQFKPQS